MAFAGETLYVADAENHSVRAVDLATGEIRTLAGSGKQMRTRADSDGGAMSSPWDVALIGDTIYRGNGGSTSAMGRRHEDRSLARSQRNGR